MLTPWNCDIVVLTHIGMQYFHKHAFWDITRQNRSNGLTPSCAEEQIKKHKPLTFHPFVVVTHLNRSTCHLGCWVALQTRKTRPMSNFMSIGKGVSPWQHPQKCHFLYFFERPLQQFCTTVQTVTGVLSRTVSELSQLIVQISHTLRIWATLWGA